MKMMNAGELRDYLAKSQSAGRWVRIDDHVINMTQVNHFQVERNADKQPTYLAFYLQGVAGAQNVVTVPWSSAAETFLTDWCNKYADIYMSGLSDDRR